MAEKNDKKKNDKKLNEKEFAVRRMNEKKFGEKKSNDKNLRFECEQNNQTANAKVKNLTTNMKANVKAKNVTANKKAEYMTAKNLKEENEKSLLGLICIARKAGFCIVGQDNLKGYTKKLYLLLVDACAGNALKKSMNFLAKQSGAQMFLVKNLSKICNIENCKVMGIKNKAFAEKIIEKLC